MISSLGCVNVQPRAKDACIVGSEADAAAFTEWRDVVAVIGLGMVNK
jgi:hypothetical protein